MRFLPRLPSLLVLGLAVSASSARSEDPPTSSPAAEAVAAKLPSELGAAAKRWLRGDEKELKALTALSTPALEQAVMVGLASEPGAAQFVLGRMSLETAQTDREILRVMGHDAFWADEPDLPAKLQNLAETAADPDLMLDYLDAERRIEDKKIRQILTRRIADARSDRSSTERSALADADERWIMLERGATLPAFMRHPPPVFSVKAASASIRVVAIGDFGSGLQGQRDVAAAIVKMGRKQPFDFGLTLGDNFYPSGMTGPEDPRWHDWWEALYGPLHAVFYPALGNHEWYSDDGAAAEIAYQSASWCFPSPYYTFTAGSVQFFAVDTTEISEAQVRWLDRAIAASTARWKVVYGHHPIFAPERDAKAGIYMDYMRARLWPVIRNRVDAYLCGHQHAMAHMQPVDGVHFFMSGGGGAPLNKVAANAPGTLFAESRYGFLTLETDATKLYVSIYDVDGKAFASEAITK